MADTGQPHPQVPAATLTALSTPTEVRRNCLDINALGLAPTIKGDDVGLYQRFYVQLTAAIMANDAIEEILCDRIIDLQWEIVRFRRCKTVLIDSLAHIGLRSALKPFLDPDVRNELVRRWLSGDEAAKAEVNNLLKQLGSVDDVITAHTILEIFDKLEGFDRVIAKMEERLDAALHDIERRREALARRARQALADVEDAEIASAPVTKEAA